MRAGSGLKDYDGGQETEALPLAGFTVCVYSPLAEETRAEVDYSPLG